MGIDLGLGRVRTLLSHLGNPHLSSYKSVHIAGTNGKGSAIAYISLILTRSAIRNGRFTSPHLLSYNDCISINGQTYSLDKFENVRQSVLSQNARFSVGCSEFEILTATAFKIFEIEKVELALIEVGLGGRLDATNVLPPCSGDRSLGGAVVCGITKIGMDHEAFLGSTLKAVAREKAGIIKKSTPVVVDATNEPAILDEIEEEAAAKNAMLIRTDRPLDLGITDPVEYSPLLGDYQTANLLVALQIVQVLRDVIPTGKLTKETIIAGTEQTSWPGRLQRVTDKATGVEFLLDGAHNECAAIELGRYLRRIRKNGILFVVAMSEGKSVENLLKHVAMKGNDALIPFEFTPPLHMLWVKCQDASNIGAIARNYVDEVIDAKPHDVEALFQLLSAKRCLGDLRDIVICGSLYLCSDILRRER